MARVSRKTKEKGTSVTAYNRIWKTAIYARLSNLNAGKQDTETLEVQIAYVKMNLESMPELQLVDIYADNGYTGINFERPEFEKLLSDVQAKRIDCIIVKDLSRFGRNFLDAGYYLEKLFPFMGVRFIAINDRYDSEASSSQNGMTVPIKGMLNELYSRDLSVKIKKTFEQKENRGEVFWTLPFGYIKDEMHPGKIAIDTEMAPFIKMIFNWKIQNVSQREIARRLTELGVPIPFVRRRELGLVSNGELVQRTDWVYKDIYQILRDPIYTGDVVYNRMAYKGHYKNTGRENPRDEWRVVENAHPAIIDHETYETVRKSLEDNKLQYRLRVQQSEARRKEVPNIFEGLVFCAECGKVLHHVRRAHLNKPRFSEYCCRNKKGCINHFKIASSLLQILVMDQIRLQIQLGMDIEQMKKDWLTTSEYSKKKVELQNQREARQKVYDSFRAKKRRAYEDFAEGLLNVEEFQAVREDIEHKAEAAKGYLEETISEAKELEELLKVEADFQKFLKMKPEELSFSEELMRSFVNRIEVNKDGNISLQFHFQNQTLKYLKMEELTK